jgi:predicted MFS family arabinose efflux permease
LARLRRRLYRLWRDFGYAAGALVAGIAADALGLDKAIWLVAAITLVSGIVVAVRMRETHRRDAPASGFVSDKDGTTVV